MCWREVKGRHDRDYAKTSNPAHFGMSRDFVDSDDEFDDSGATALRTPERALTPVNKEPKSSPPYKSKFLAMVDEYGLDFGDDWDELENQEMPAQKAAAAPEDNSDAQVRDVGLTVGKDEFGEWKTVPGVDKIHVSSKGYVRRVDASGHHPAVLPKPGTLGYRCIGIGGAMHKVSRLVCRAFHGECPPNFTCLHISKGDNMIAARADDRAENLRWASRADLVHNRRKCKRQRTGKAIFVRHIQWEDTVPSLRFETATQADEALKVSGLRHAANPVKSGLVDRVWKAWWEEPQEPQQDLPATETKPAEVWVDVGDSLRVSNRGRAQTLQNQHKWGRIFVPRRSEGEQYPTVGRHQYFHHVLWHAFKDELPNKYIVDHLDGDPENNELSNLKAMSWFEHNAELGKKRKRFLV